MARKWIQRLKLKKGKTRQYLYARYGKRAFTKEGKIKIEFLNRAIKTTKNTKVKRRLILARTFKRIRK